MFIIHTRYSKTSKTSKHEFTRKAKSQTTAHPKLLFRLSSFLFLEHQSVNAKRRALIILSGVQPGNRAKFARQIGTSKSVHITFFFLEKTASNKTQIFLCHGPYQVHIVLTSHQTFHHQTFTQAILPSEMLDHFFDTSRLNCSFFTFFPACFSRKSERDNIPRISRNLWQACAKPWEYNQVALNAEWRPVLFLNSNDWFNIIFELPACMLP